MINKNRYLYYSILPCLLLLITIGVYVSGYNPPTQSPPLGNLPAPINAGLDPQTKAGNLTIQGNLTTGSFTMAAEAGANKVLTTNASGVATWQTAAGGATPGGTTGFVQFNDGSIFAATSTFYWDNTNARLGIGTTAPKTKLDVAGAIKIGTQDICDSDTEGAIRYNSTSKKFEGCDGEAWDLIVGRPTWLCGSSITFFYKNSFITYGTVKNTTTSECWLDRNLGASRVATAFNDSLAYGDLFQWGRLDDGHQIRTSGTTTTLSSSDNPGHSNFILAPNSPYDWRSPRNDNLWQGVSGINNPCPLGWRLPTSAEWDTERASWSQQNFDGAFGSPLKLTAADWRYSTNGNLDGRAGSIGRYWSKTVNGTNAIFQQIGEGLMQQLSYTRAYGMSVRCVQD